MARAGEIYCPARRRCRHGGAQPKGPRCRLRPRAAHAGAGAGRPRSGAHGPGRAPRECAGGGGRLAGARADRCAGRARPRRRGTPDRGGAGARWAGGGPRSPLDHLPPTRAPSPLPSLSSPLLLAETNAAQARRSNSASARSTLTACSRRRRRRRRSLSQSASPCSGCEDWGGCAVRRSLSLTPLSESPLRRLVLLLRTASWATTAAFLPMARCASCGAAK